MRFHRVRWFAALVTLTSLGCSASPDAPGRREKGRSHDDAVNSSQEANAFPEAVEVDLVITDPSNPSKCTGTLIRSNVVLTAKHCFQAATTSFVHRAGGADPAVVVDAVA